MRVGWGAAVRRQEPQPRDGVKKVLLCHRVRGRGLGGMIDSFTDAEIGAIKPRWRNLRAERSTNGVHTCIHTRPTRTDGLTYADHDRGVDLVGLVLGGFTLDPEVGPQVALAYLVEVLASERLEHLERKTERERKTRETHGESIDEINYSIEFLRRELKILVVRLAERETRPGA